MHHRLYHTQFQYRMYFLVHETHVRLFSEKGWGKVWCETGGYTSIGLPTRSNSLMLSQSRHLWREAGIKMGRVSRRERYRSTLSWAVYPTKASKLLPLRLRWLDSWWQGWFSLLEPVTFFELAWLFLMEKTWSSCLRSLPKRELGFNLFSKIWDIKAQRSEHGPRILQRVQLFCLSLDRTCPSQ